MALRIMKNTGAGERGFVADDLLQCTLDSERQPAGAGH